MEWRKNDICFNSGFTIKGTLNLNSNDVLPTLVFLVNKTPFFLMSSPACKTEFQEIRPKLVPSKRISGKFVEHARFLLVK